MIQHKLPSSLGCMRLREEKVLFQHKVSKAGLETRPDVPGLAEREPHADNHEKDAAEQAPDRAGSRNGRGLPG